MLKLALALPTSLAFVARDAFGAIPASAYRVAGQSPSVLMPLGDEPAAAVDSAARSTEWHSATGLQARRIEGAVVAAICVYCVAGVFQALLAF